MRTTSRSSSGRPPTTAPCPHHRGDARVSRRRMFDLVDGHVGPTRRRRATDRSAPRSRRSPSAVPVGRRAVRGDRWHRAGRYRLGGTAPCGRPRLRSVRADHPDSPDAQCGRTARRRRRVVHPSDRRDARPCGPGRPVLDREGLRDGRRARRLVVARLRTRQVHEPQRARRLRRRLAGNGAVDRPGESAAERRSRPHRRRPAPLRRARAVPAGAVPLRRQRRRPDRVRVDLRRCGPSAARASRRPALAAGLPPRRRGAALPPDRRRLGLGRGRRHPHRPRGDRVVLDARPLLGRAPGRRPPAHRPRRRQPARRPGPSVSRGARCCSNAPTAPATRSITSIDTCG